MMKLTFDEICNTHDTHYEDHIVETHTVSGETLKDCFRKAYPEHRSLRYCYGYRIQFRDPKIQEQWEVWLRTGVSMAMYYGGATVD